LRRIALAHHAPVLAPRLRGWKAGLLRTTPLRRRASAHLLRLITCKRASAAVDALARIRTGSLKAAPRGHTEMAAW